MTDAGPARRPAASTRPVQAEPGRRRAEHPDTGPAAARLRQLDAGRAGGRTAGRGPRRRGAAAHLGDVRGGRTSGPAGDGVPGLPGAERRLPRRLLAVLRPARPGPGRLRARGGVRALPGHAPVAVPEDPGPRPGPAAGGAGPPDRPGVGLPLVPDPGRTGQAGPRRPRTPAERAVLRRGRRTGERAARAARPRSRPRAGAPSR